MNIISPETRAAILSRLVGLAPGKALGRTQLMKLFYFLQELYGVEMGYDFRLFNYGPFDSEVLGDLSLACGLNLVIEETVIYPKGYGYEIKPGRQADRLDDIDPSLNSAIEQVVQEFGTFSASELELQSTILFVDREFAEASRNYSAEDIVDRVGQIKPHFDHQTIRRNVSKMKERGHLKLEPPLNPPSTFRSVASSMT